MALVCLCRGNFYWPPHTTILFCSIFLDKIVLDTLKSRYHRSAPLGIPRAIIIFVISLPFKIVYEIFADIPFDAPIIPVTDEKYSLQGTTQGRYLTGGVPPVRFSM